MKLLTRLRELRIEDPVEQLFDNFHYSIESFNTEALGLGTTVHEDIIRINDDSFNIEKNNLKNS
jgi:hypothetical protein